MLLDWLLLLAKREALLFLLHYTNAKTFNTKHKTLNFKANNIKIYLTDKKVGCVFWREN